MKTRHDPRHLERIKIMQEIFAWEFEKKANQLTIKAAKKIKRALAQIDKHIHESAPSWPLEKINKIDLAILRLAIYELIVDQKNPPKVVVDEAVEIAKEFGGESSPGFINGALGKLITIQDIKT